MRIEVTEEDVVLGRGYLAGDTPRSIFTHCPVALALRRALPKADIRMGWSIATIDGRSYNLGDRVGMFVNAAVENPGTALPTELPFEFELPLEPVFVPPVMDEEIHSCD